MKRLSELLIGIESELVTRPVTLKHLLEVLGSRGHSLFTLFLSLPFLLPVPMPGVSVVVGFLFIVIGARFFVGKGPWIPRRLENIELPKESCKKIFHYAAVGVKKLEPLIRPRYEKIFEWRLIKKWEGIVIASCGFFLALPLPPGTNFPPASAILILSLANLEKDGLLAGLGTVVFFLNVCFFSAIGFLGIEGIQKLVEALNAR